MIQQLEDYIKMRMKTDKSNQKQFRQHKHQPENNCIGISSDKQVKSDKRKVWHGKKVNLKNETKYNLIVAQNKP